MNTTWLHDTQAFHNGTSWATYRYLFNAVTFSYTTAWYDWPQWEYLLDWASLHGINLPLAISGQEL